MYQVRQVSFFLLIDNTPKCVGFTMKSIGCLPMIVFMCGERGGGEGEEEEE